ncbi:hypothetical protein BH09BAC5_BH09BAC5_01860 [soil metagenome]
MKKTLTSIILFVFLFGFESKAQLSIATDSILQLSTCAGGNIIVPYTVSGGNYAFGNTFTAQLSNNFGQFTSPVNIGSLFYWSSGIIFCTIPANTNFGFLYKIRVISSNPQDTGTPCPNTLIITQVAQLNQIISNPGDTMCAGDSITLTSINLANAYSWSTGDTTMSITVGAPGIYSVTTTDFLGCESTTSDTIVSSACTGVMENDFENALSVYPNPTSGKIYFSWKASGTEMLNVHLYNSLGAEILRVDKMKVNSITENELDLSNVVAGIYFLVIENGPTRITRKIIVD